MSSMALQRSGQHLQPTRPRLGFAGVGWIGANRMRALCESKLGEPCAIFEPDPNMSASATTIAPGCTCCESFEALLDSGIGGLVIATPSALHAEQTAAALERGLAVFCQKPLGRNAEETARTIDAAKSADRLLKVDLSYRFMEPVRKIRELIASGELGSVYFVELVFHNAYGPDKPWFYDPRLSGGGCLIDLGIHLVDLGLWMLEFPGVRHVSSKLYREGRPFLGRSFEVEDFAATEIEVETGTRLNITCSWRASAGRDAVIEATFHGTKGAAKLRNVNGSFYDFVAERFRGTYSEVLCSPPDLWGGRAALDWLSTLCNAGNHFDSEICTLNAVAETLDRVYEP